ncbi:MAG: hypothetical protein JST38_08890 [Bacteroidetes bacterium]|nr:hypothetical protein [Bacteroidota bacterium]
MNIEQLSKILPKPRHPVEIPEPTNWVEVDNHYGTMPSELKKFVNFYGTGSIDGFIWIHNPIAKNPHLNFLVQAKIMLEALLETSENSGDCPYPIFPKTGGLIPFGKTDNGDGLYWLSNGPSDQWSIVVNAGRDAKFERFEIGLIELIGGLVKGKLSCSIFPEDFPSEHPQFLTQV